MAGTIITVKAQKGFTVFPNRTLRDNRLSLKTRALLAIMVSLPEDWDYTVSGLASICGVGKDAVRTSLLELETCGYLTRAQRHSESGRFSQNEYIVTDTPLSGYPSTGEPLTGNPTQQNKDCTNTPYSPPEGDAAAPVQKCAKQGVDWALFEQFWAAYPRKQNKERARRAWRKLNPDIALCRVMSKALEQDKRSEQWRRDGGDFIPHPSSWLNGRRWEDEHRTHTTDQFPAPLRGEGVVYT